MDLQLPPIYLLPTHLSADELQKWQDKIPTITCDVSKTNFIVGKISQKTRAKFELRKLRLSTEEIVRASDGPTSPPGGKMRKIRDTEGYAFLSDSSTDSDDGSTASDGKSQKLSSAGDAASREGSVKVVRLAWLRDSMSRGRLLDYREYLIYEAVREAKKAATPGPADLMRRAREVAATASQHSMPRRGPYQQERDMGRRVQAPALLPHPTTDDAMASLPPIPEHLKTKHSCQRPTLVHPPNEAFIEKLKEVRELRAMKGDGVGVRAYSTAIASLSAYPYKLQSPTEIPRLPGCGEKYALLFAEFENTGHLSELQRAATDAKTSVIKTFYNIWGVSAVTADEFYKKGWRDLDDVVEFGWNDPRLSRSQQIGVKYYDEFLQKIPRAEVESIAKTVLEHANSLRKGFQLMIVGGYRRGKTMSGDVDLVLSHPDADATHKFISKLASSLIDARFITHTLTVSEHNSERGQRPTSFKGAGPAGTGFDMLDKALVVWQDPDFKPTNASPKNNNPHRRVDIIVSPWQTVGCAVLGWSSETTFQRDLRRYCKERGLKFDSSGIRSREHPFHWVDLEDGGRGPPASMEEAERRVFDGLELEWRPPEERCTG